MTPLARKFLPVRSFAVRSYRNSDIASALSSRSRCRGRSINIPRVCEIQFDFIYGVVNGRRIGETWMHRVSLPSPGYFGPRLSRVSLDKKMKIPETSPVETRDLP